MSIVTAYVLFRCETVIREVASSHPHYGGLAGSPGADGWGSHRQLPGNGRLRPCPQEDNSVSQAWPLSSSRPHHVSGSGQGSSAPTVPPAPPSAPPLLP